MSPLAPRPVGLLLHIQGAARTVAGPDGGISYGFADAAPGERDGLPPPAVLLIAAIFFRASLVGRRPGPAAAQANAQHSRSTRTERERELELRVCVSRGVDLTRRNDGGHARREGKSVCLAPSRSTEYDRPAAAPLARAPVRRSSAYKKAPCFQGASWRRGWDSNPRYRKQHTRFRV